jgi:RHS repeat-associated protein
MIGQTDSLGNHTSFGYQDATHGIIVGNLISVEDSLGNVTSYQYDAQNRVQTVVNAPITLVIGQPPVSGRVVYNYDLNGNLASVTDPDGNVTAYHYDNADRLWYTTSPGANQSTNYITYSYDTANRLVSIKDAMNQTRTFGYDAADRQISERWLDSGNNEIRSMVYGYDAANRLTSAGDPSATFAFGYDSDNRLTSAATSYSYIPYSVVLNYGYDGFNDRTSLSDNILASGYDQITYSYNADFQLTGATWKVNNTQLAQVSMHYDGRNRMDAIYRSGTGLVNVNTAISYDANDQVLAITHSTTVTLAAFTYGYDHDRRLLFSQGPEGTRTYAYDAANELIGVTATNSNLNESYLYDLNGNRTSANGVNYGAVTVANLLPSDGVYTYAYDANGNVTLKSAPGDVTAFTYDYRNRLLEANRVTATGSYDDKFTYDVFDRRVNKSVTGSLTYSYATVYDGDNAYGDYVSGNWTRYLAGDQVDELFARYDSTNGVEWYLTDRLGSVRDIVNGGGVVTYSVYYDSFGNIPSGAETNPTNGDRFKFTGREWDGEIGQYYSRERYFDARVGRFDSEDPVGFAAGDSNLYRYVENDPTDGTDPYGLQSKSNTVVINIIYTTKNLKVTDKVKNEVDRIFQDCMKREGDPSKKLVVLFTSLSQEKYAQYPFGWRSDFWLNVGFEDDFPLEKAGQQGGWKASLNEKVILANANKLGVDFELGVATAIAHELGGHAIAGLWTHTYPDGAYVDSTHGKVGGVFSYHACVKFVRALGVQDPKNAKIPLPSEVGRPLPK